MIKLANKIIEKWARLAEKYPIILLISFFGMWMLACYLEHLVDVLYGVT